MSDEAVIDISAAYCIDVECTCYNFGSVGEARVSVAHCIGSEVLVDVCCIAALEPQVPGSQVPLTSDCLKSPRATRIAKFERVPHGCPPLLRPAQCRACNLCNWLNCDKHTAPVVSAHIRILIASLSC